MNQNQAIKIVNIIAHNEEKVIADTIASLLRQKTGGQLEIHVFANGCTDRTEAIVEEISRTKPNIVLHRVAQKGKVKALEDSVRYFRDRSEAEHSVPDRLYYVDADIELPDEETLNKLSAVLDRSEELYLVSAYPAPQSLHNDKKDYVSELFRVRAHLHNIFEVNMIRGACYVIRREILNKISFPEGLLSDDMYLECCLQGHFLMDHSIQILTELKQSLRAEINRDRFHLIAREQVYNWNRQGLIPRVNPETARKEWRLTHQAPKIYLTYLIKRFKVKALFYLFIWHIIHKRNEKISLRLFKESQEKGIDLHVYWTTQR